MLDSKEYITFVLGYDELIRVRFNEVESMPCDRAYEICNNIAKDFMQSDYYNDFNISMYDALRSYLNETDIDSYFFCNVRKGSKIIIDYNTCGDTDLTEWCYDHAHTMLTVSSVGYENGMCWAENCPYGIQLNEIIVIEY